MWTKSNREHNTLLSFSPWILGAACLLLLLVLAIFAVSNYKRERVLIIGTLEQKGLTLIRFINSSVRETIRDKLRSQEKWQSWDDHMKMVLEMAVEQPGVERILVTDAEGKILLRASREPGEDSAIILQKGELQLVQKLSRKNMQGWSSRLLHDEVRERDIFLVAAYHQPPFFQRMGRHRGMNKRFMHHPHFQKFREEMQHLKELKPVFLVQLDSTQFDTPLKKQFLQIVLQLIVIGLVAIGGALSFLTLRGLKGTERNLGRVKAFNEKMVSSLPVGLLATDGGGIIRICNTSASNILGIEESELIGRRPDRVLPFEFTGIFAGDTEESGTEYEKNVDITLAGRTKHLNLLATSVEYEKSKSIGIVLLIRDLTRIRNLEKELHRSERLASLGKMAAGVAHELRNPLSSIKGLALLLQPHFEEGSSEAKNTDTLVREVDRLNRGIGELLDFARPTKLKREEASIEEIIRKTTNLVEMDAESYGITTEIDCENDLPPIYIDGDKISQVLLNIFLNSIQSMELLEHGKTGVLSVNARVQEEHIVLIIRDNGQGIAPENMKRIFDPYFTTKNEGTGLGLALSAKIVEEHGGRIEVSSVVKEYTEMVVFLPKSQPDTDIQ